MVVKSLRVALLSAAILLAATAAMAKDDVLSLVPADAVTVGVVHLDQLRTSPLSSMLFEHTDRVGGNGDAQKFLAEAGLEPARDVDILLVATSPKERLGSEPEVLLVASGRFNVERLTKAMVSRGAVRKNGYLVMPDSHREQGDHNGAVAFASPSLAILGSESAVAEALATRASGGSAFAGASLLGRDAARIDPNATAWAVVDVNRAQRFGEKQRYPKRQDQSGEAFAAAIGSVSTIAVWAKDTGDSLELGAFGLAGDQETLQLVEDTLRGALAALRLAVKDKQPDMVPVLRRFDVARTDDSVRITGSIPAETLRKAMAKHRAQK